jgi:uncharacterized delta-60 repeat protein
MKNRNSFHKPALIAVSLALILTTVAFAASGDLDATFSGDGKIMQGFGGSQHLGRDLAVQSDGKLVVVGDKWTTTGNDFAIARYNVNGSLDATFSGDGKQTVNIGPDDRAMSVAIQTDGRIVVAGEACIGNPPVCDVAVARLNPNGSLDPTFSGDGKVRTHFGSGNNGGLAVAIQNGKIVVAGYAYQSTNYNATIYRYNANGSLDTTFSADGILPINFGGQDMFYGIAVYSGKIFVTGNSESMDSTTSDIITARVNSNGTLDATFSGDGKVRTNLGVGDYGQDIVIANGNAVVGGNSDTTIVILRFTSTGDLDHTFSNDGILTDALGLAKPWLIDVALQSGNIVVVGSTGEGNALVARFTSAGDIDTTFSTDGIVTTDWGGNDLYTAVKFKNARIYVTGMSMTTSFVRRFIVAAYLP